MLFTVFLFLVSLSLFLTRSQKESTVQYFVFCILYIRILYEGVVEEVSVCVSNVHTRTRTVRTDGRTDGRGL